MSAVVEIPLRDRDGVVRAHAVVDASWRGRRVKPACFFAGRPGAGPCHGALIRAHLIPKQLLKREFPHGVTLSTDRDGWLVWGRYDGHAEFVHLRSLRSLMDDPRSWVPCCGGPMGLSGHHGMFDIARKLRLDRESLPLAVEEFAAELGLSWWLDREYGSVAA